MVRKSKKQNEFETTTQQGAGSMEASNSYIEPIINYNTAAYSMFEGNGKYHVVRIPFDSVTLQNGNVEIIESNTEKLIIQERLQVLLFGADIL